jgi:hypothetical protein
MHLRMPLLLPPALMIFTMVFPLQLQTVLSEHSAGDSTSHNQIEPVVDKPRAAALHRSVNLTALSNHTTQPTIKSLFSNKTQQH